MRVPLMNSRSGGTIASTIELAVTRAARRRGLLRRDALDPATALVLAPCLAIHTAFMRFAIDVVFVDREGCVRRIVRRLQPWRVAGSRHACATIELAAGALDACDVTVGDRLYLGTNRCTAFDAGSLWRESQPSREARPGPSD